MMYEMEHEDGETSQKKTIHLFWRRKARLNKPNKLKQIANGYTWKWQL